MSEHLEKPDYTQYVKPEKLFMRSRGQCICKSSRERRECLHYSDKDGHCKHIDKVLWIACLWKENNT